MDFDSLRYADFRLLDGAVADWKTLIRNLDELKEDAENGLHKAANAARWEGVNQTVSKAFISKTAGEFADAHTQAKTIHGILSDTRDELKQFKRDLEAAVQRGRKQGMWVGGDGKNGFTITADMSDQSGSDKPSESEMEALRDEVSKILTRAHDSDSSADKVLRALVDQSYLGFSDAQYKDRDSAADAVKAAEDAAKIAAQDPKDLSPKEFDKINNALRKYRDDPLFAEHFATTLGPRRVLEFYAGVNDPSINRDLIYDRGDKFDDLQRNLGLTLAEATQSDSTKMSAWKFDVIEIGDRPVSPASNATGFQAMSNLMRVGDYDDQFLESYGRELVEADKRLTGNGEDLNTAWQYGPNLNNLGQDSGNDPFTGYFKSLSNSPDAATTFFSDEYVSEDDSPFRKDDDGDGNKERRALSNFDYFFEEREWPEDSYAKEAGRNTMAMALEAATTGHPAGELPTSATVAHSPEQAALFKEIVQSVSAEPERLTGNGFMSDSFGQITAEYMPDINRAFSPGDKDEDKLFIAPGATANLDEGDATRFLYTLGRNPEGYAAVTLGQHNYTSNLFEYHAAHPDAYPEGENGRKPSEYAAKAAGEVQGILGGGRAFETESGNAAKDAEYNQALDKASTWGGALAGTGIGMMVAPTAGPGAVVAGSVASTFATEAISSITGGMKQDSTDDVLYSNGKEWDKTHSSTYDLLEREVVAAEKATGNSNPGLAGDVSDAAEAGFNNASTNVKNHIDGESIPRTLG